MFKRKYNVDLFDFFARPELLTDEVKLKSIFSKLFFREVSKINRIKKVYWKGIVKTLSGGTDVDFEKRR